MQVKVKKYFAVVNVLFLLAAIIAPFLAPQKSEAAAFGELYVRLNTLSAGTTGGTVCVNPGSQASSTNDVQVTFPTALTVNTTAANWTVTTSNLPTGTTAWTNITTASGVSGKTVTFAMTSAATLATTNTYCFNFSGTTTLTTTAGDDMAGTITTRDSGAATIDTGKYSLSVVSDSTVVVSAVVPPTFAFDLTDNVDAFTSDLSQSSVVSTSGETMTISTNAANGWIAWVKSANAALVGTGTISTAGSIDGSPSTLSAGTSGYVLDVDSGSGSPTIAAEYNGGASAGGTLSTSFQQVASTTSPGASNTVTFVSKAAISATQAAGTNYTDTLTVVAAGMF